MRKLGLAVVSLFFVHSSFGREITLEEAIKSGLENSYEVKASYSLVKSKEYMLEAVKGYRMPSLTFSEMFMRTNEPGYAMWNTMSQKRLDFMNASNFVDMSALNPMFGGMINFNKPSYPAVSSWRTKLELQIPIYTGGKIESGIYMQRKDYESSQKDYLRAKEKAIYDISKAYYGALLAKEAIKLANQAYIDVEKHYNTAKSMVANGLAIVADELRAKVYLEDVKSKIREAENNYIVAKRGLLLAMGDDKSSPQDIEVVGELKCDVIKNNPEYFQDYAISNRADFLAVKDKVMIAKKMVELNKSDMLPTVGAFASYELNDRKLMLGDEGKWWMAGFAINWRIFDGFNSLNRYRSSKEAYNQYKQQEKGFEEFIKFSVYKAFKEYEVQLEKLNTAEENLKYAQEILKITEVRYRNQLASMIDLLDTQTLYDKIKFDRAQAIYQCQTAVLELKYQSGILIDENKN